MCGISKELKKAEEIDLTGEDLHRMTDGKSNIIKYSDLRHYNNINDALGQYGACIILHEEEMNYGHWVLLFKVNNTTLEHFDSYGLTIEQELRIAPQTTDEQGRPLLSTLINKSGYKLIENLHQLQRKKEDVNTCGRFVVVRLRFRDEPLNEFIKLLTKNHHFDPDFWVSALTYLL
jgi:hypothetical protein